MTLSGRQSTPASDNDNMFVELYWKYFAAGLIAYLIARSIFTLFGGRKRAENSPRHEAKYKTVDTDDEDEYSNGSSEKDDELSPSLPSDLKHVELEFKKLPVEDMLRRSEEFYNLVDKRRTVRHFSPENVPIEIIRNVIKAAGTAPSGAHTEPWTYVLVKSKEVKEKIREIIEAEEEINYKRRMGKVWTTDLKPLKTNWIKEYITEAPYIILIFKQLHNYRNDGKKKMHYYSEHSVSIAAGILLTAIHYAGLVALTSTPLNCGPALKALLERPPNEKLVYLVPVGYPAEDCLIPQLKRKPLDEILVEF